MNSESEVDYVEKISFELSDALESQREVEDEIFCILVHVSPFFGHVIPLHNDISSPYNEKAFKLENRASYVASKQTCSPHVKSIIDQLEAFYLKKVKENFPDSGNNEISLHAAGARFSNGQLNAICVYLEKLQVLIGHKLAVERFHYVISRHVDMLLRQFSLYEQNPLPNLFKLEKEYIALFAYVKAVIFEVIYVLTCAKLFTDKSGQLAFIKDVILEKLTIELLTLTCSIKDSLAKSSLSRPKQSKSETLSNKQRIKFLSNISFEDVHLTDDMLSNFAAILAEYLTLEKALESSDVLAVLDHKNSSNKKSVLKQHSLELPDLIKTSQQSSILQSAPRYNKWEWCETLQEFAPVLSSSLMHCLQETNNKLTEETKKQCLNSINELETLPSISRTLGGVIKGQPMKVLKSTGSVLSLAVTWLPFGIIGKKHRFMSKLRSDFIDVVNQVLKESKQFLMDIIEDIPEKISPSILPILLATCLDVVIVLQQFEEKLLQDNRLPFTGTIKMFLSLCNHIHQILLQYHKAQLSTKILHDAESNYWSDPRAFAENERCSYSVEMWQIYLTNLHRELFDAVGYEMTQQIASEIFGDSLSILANRYSNCQPSDRRHLQIGRDVSEILRFAFSFLWKILPSSHMICPVKDTNQFSTPNVVFEKIHTACKDFYCCINILASPLIEFYEAVRMLDQCEVQTVACFNWLTALNLSIFPAGWNGKSSRLSDDAYIFCILKHLLVNPDKRLVLTMEAMTARKCFLFQKLFLLKSQFTDVDFQVMECLLKVSSFQDSISCNLLLKNNNASFTDLGFLWEKRESSYLPWQVVLRNELVANVGNSLQPALHFLSLHCLSSFTKNLCKKLPSEVVVSIPGVYNEDTKEILYFCIMLILQGLRSFALSLAPFVTSLLVAIDEKIHRGCSKSILLHDSYGAHVLLHLASAFLTNQHLLQSLSVELTPAVTTALHEVARFLLEMNNLQANPAEGNEKSHEKLLQEITSYRTYTFSLFSYTNHVQEEKEFNAEKFEHLLETDSLSKSDLFIIQNLSKWIVKNCSSIVKHLNLKTTNISKG